jgi:peptidoglycan/xylan/chitin deacetylase (PgdA/CDA1 family)
MILACITSLLISFPTIPPRYVGQTVPENWSPPAGFTKKVVALTFDDGPHGVQTQPIINILKNAEVPATFFLVGSQVELRENLAKSLADETLFELANHTYSHINNPPADVGVEEFKKTFYAIAKYRDPHSLLFRPPYGQRNASPSIYARSIGYACVLWTNDSHDWELLDPTVITNTVASQMRPGDIVLLHDNRPGTPVALPNIINTYKQQGYTFITATQMLWEWNTYLNQLTKS